MNTINANARRYHWYSDEKKNFMIEPHSAICAEIKNPLSLDLTARGSLETQKISTEIISGGFNALIKDLWLLRSKRTTQSSVMAFRSKNEEMVRMDHSDRDFGHLPVVDEDFSKSKYLRKILYDLSEKRPRDYEAIVSSPGVGPKTIRALALVAEIIYGASPSYEDPARFSFAHGGKDHVPYPVDKNTYDHTIDTMKRLVSCSKIAISEKNKMHARLRAKSKNVDPC